MRQLLLPSLPEEGSFLADPDGSHHLLHVLRLERGALLTVSDGRGLEGEARLTSVERNLARLELVQLRRLPPPLPRLVLLGVPKPALLEEALTLGTEAGATTFRLLRCRYSQVLPLRQDRLEKILRTAATQCRRSWLPTIEGPLDLSAAVADLPPTRFLAEAGAPALASCAEAATLAIGPEGGFHPEEISFFQEAGFVPAGLGPHILRNPTAVAVGLGRLFTTAG